MACIFTAINFFLKEIIIYTFFFITDPFSRNSRSRKKKSPTSPINISAFDIVYAAQSVACFAPEKL